VNKLLLLSLLTFLSSGAIAQVSNPSEKGGHGRNRPGTETRLEDSLLTALASATAPAEKVKWQAELASYYTGLDPQKSKDYTSKMLETAETSRDRKLIVTAMLRTAGNYYDYGTQQDGIRKGLEYAQNALDISRNNNLEEYIAWSYISLSRGSRANGDIDKGLNYSNLAVSIAMSSKSDSLKVVAYNSLGNSYLYKKEKLLAYRNYLSALDLAEESGKYDLIKACYVRMIDFNRTLENWDKAKDYQYRIDSLARANNRYYDVLEGYNTAGSLYASAKQYDLARMYYDKSLALSDTLDFKYSKIGTYVNIVNLYLTSNRYREALDYFAEKQELRQFLKTAGMEYILDQSYGSLYTYVGKYDSASFYFKRAEPYFETLASKPFKYFFYANYSVFHKFNGDYKQAINYWGKALEIGRQLNSFDMIINSSANLDSLHVLVGDYKTAYQHKTTYINYKDSVEKLAKEKDLLIMEVESEKQKAEKRQLLREEQTRRRHNLQYMGITASIASIFILLVMAGAFSVSSRTIKILGFFAFIFLFEFIILLADNQIHHLTHGEPWMVLATKIVLIAMLLPLHHWLEEKAVHYLTSKSILKLKPRGSFSRRGKSPVVIPVRNSEGH
jgi:tetratricopeptide (TPR) repeat protein